MPDKLRTPLDALELLMQDHREVESLCRDFQNLHDDAQASAELIREVCAELVIHDKLETDIFYPAVREAADAQEIDDLLDDGEDDHDDILELIEALDELGPGDAQRDAQFLALSQHVARHVEEEETNLFPRVRKLKALDLIALADEMKTRRSELMGDAEVGAEAA
jgi:hemerythrin superfamily protein